MTGDQSLFTKPQLTHRPPSPYPQHLIFPVKPFMVEKKNSNFTVFISSVLSDPSRIIYHRFMSCPQTTSAELLWRAQYLHPKHICRSKHWNSHVRSQNPNQKALDTFIAFAGFFSTKPHFATHFEKPFLPFFAPLLLVGNFRLAFGARIA